jgi:glucosaminylphosphatidylinositol acyltransferase
MLWTALQRTQSFFTPYTPLACLVDFLLNICAILFAFTAYSSVPLALNIFLATPAVLLLLLQQPKKNAASNSKKEKPKKAEDSTDDAPLGLVSRPFLTHYRGAMMIATLIAILAVDFPIFPRRFAKVETWGASLMDLGVGSFVFAAGVVSARTLYKKDGSGQNQPSFGARMLASVRHSIPLLILGFIRLMSVKGLEYAEHVTEYGVHWNFFFTLGFLPPFVELADSIPGMRSRHSSYAILALLLSVVYEVVLNNTELLSYILISPRGPDLLSKNREGVFSFIGYLAVFLKGRSTGAPLVALQAVPAPRSTTSSKERASKERMILLRKLAFDAAFNASLFFLATSVFGFNLNVSRRLANFPYVMWIAAFNSAQIALFALVEACGPPISYETQDATQLQNACSRIMALFNQNGLVVFLIANLLTGLVNMTMNTLDMPNLTAMVILILYCAAVTAVAFGLQRSGLKIRL